MCEKLEIFTSQSDSTKDLNLQYQPSSYLAMPILYNEIFFTCYRDLIKCPNKMCTNFKKNTLKVDVYETFICEVCRLNKVKKRLNFIIIDLRVSLAKVHFCKIIIQIQESLNQNKSNKKISNSNKKLNSKDSNDDEYLIKSGFLPITIIPEQDEFIDENVLINS